jgi:cobalamin biosynthesis protein CobT
MQLFEQLIFGTVVPKKPVLFKEAEEEPPDYTKRIPEEEEQQQAQAPEEMQQQPPPEEEQQEQPPPEEQQQEQQPSPEEQQAMMMQQQQQEEPSDADELDQAEAEIFKDIKPAQMAIKIEELKYQFKKFNSVIVAAMEKLDDVSHTTYDDALLEFIARKLLELKELSRDYLLKTFNTRTYIQNQIELQRMIVAFNLVTNLISEIRQSRIKRKTAIEERNNKLFKIKDKSGKLPVFSRGFDEA